MEADADLQTLLAEQSREFATAIAADSDLDLAYKLQMEEAIRVSLSTSQQQQQQFDLPNDAVSALGLVQLLADEIDRFEQQNSDHDHAQKELKRIRTDLRRRIHDHAFAAELSAIPEDQWRKNGDIVEKPYNNNNISSSVEVFMVYCKGLVNEEGDRGGIGVTICDPSGGVVLELSKGFVGGGVRQMAEVKALIEGLTAAVTLGLSRITLFCADHTVYKFVSYI